MTFGNPKIITIKDNRPASYVQALNQVIPLKPSIVMAIIPNNKVRVCQNILLVLTVLCAG